MATWQELSEDNLAAAKELLQTGRLRSSLSRSYYAAYCAVTAKLVQKKVDFPHGWNNPAHDQVIALIRDNLPLSTSSRRRILKAVNYLRVQREAADYRPGGAVQQSAAIDSVRYAQQVMEIMEEVK